MSILELQVAAHEANDVLVWTVYDHPRDYPEHFVVRAHSSKLFTPLTQCFKFATLEAARDALAEVGLFRLPPAPSDDVVIVETWV